MPSPTNNRIPGPNIPYNTFVTCKQSCRLSRGLGVNLSFVGALVAGSLIEQMHRIHLSIEDKNNRKKNRLTLEITCSIRLIIYIYIYMNMNMNMNAVTPICLTL